MRLASADTILERLFTGNSVSAPTTAKRSCAASLPASVLIAAIVSIAAPAAYAANFTCSWNDATANRTMAADWSNCNGTFLNNGQPAVPRTAPELGRETQAVGALNG
jgi:hypothetical protein